MKKKRKVSQHQRRGINKGKYHRVGKAIFEKRVALNMSQKELAEKVGLTSWDVSGVERGKYSLYAESVQKIVRHFEMTEFYRDDKPLRSGKAGGPKKKSAPKKKVVKRKVARKKKAVKRKPPVETIPDESKDTVSEPETVTDDAPKEIPGRGEDTKAMTYQGPLPWEQRLTMYLDTVRDMTNFANMERMEEKRRQWELELATRLREKQQ